MTSTDLKAFLLALCSPHWEYSNEKVCQNLFSDLYATATNRHQQRSATFIFGRERSPVEPNLVITEGPKTVGLGLPLDPPSTQGVPLHFTASL